MGKILIIAEKPQAGKDIARILGVTENRKSYMENDKYIVTWAVGHLIGLCDPEERDPQYKTWNVGDLPLPYDNGLKVLPGNSSQFKVIKQLINRRDVDFLINAGDAGREGLLIQSWIYRMCENKHPVKLLWASSLTDDAIKAAMGNLHDEKEEEFVNLLREAETRAVADQIYGYNYTRALTCLFSAPGAVLSYGRCQTPLLNLIYERDKQIENFKAEPFWTISATFNNSLQAKEIDGSGEIKRYLKETDAKETLQHCQGKQGLVKSCRKEAKQQKAPSLFNLAELQGVMGKKYGLTPDQTLDIAQKLYETYKIMSYPRTDSRYLSTDLYGEIAAHVSACNFGKFKQYIEPIKFENFPMDKAYFNNTKVSDHHALIPTTNNSIQNIYENELSDMERNAFDEIVVSLIAIFYPAYQYEITEIVVEIGPGVIFGASGTVVKEQGYKCIYELFKKDDKETQVLPNFEEGTLLTVTEVQCNADKTKPPSRYNPGNIVKLMNKYKIGTSATAANIVKTLEKRKFIILDGKKKYCSTELGRELLSCVPTVLKSKNMTLEFEEKLSKVNSGEISSEQFLNDILLGIQENIETFKKSAHVIVKKAAIGKCPLCGKEIIEGAKNWYCSGYTDDPICKFSIWKKICNKSISVEQIRKLLLSGRTDLIKGFKSSQGRAFSAYIVLKDNGSTGLEFPKQK